VTATRFVSSAEGGLASARLNVCVAVALSPWRGAARCGGGWRVLRRDAAAPGRRTHEHEHRGQPHARWLFPGRRAGQPLNPNSLLPLIRELGVPTGAGRAAALRQLVLQAPAPVIAKALGYHDKTTTVVLAEAGGTWNSYTTGE